MTSQPALDEVTYPSSDNMGEHFAQTFIAELLRKLVAARLRELHRVAFAGADQFIYFVEGDPRKRRAPDVYVLDGVAQEGSTPASWKTWEGHRPSFVLEVASDDWKKDYVEAPRDYAAMGVREAVIFDPWATARSRKRVRWQVLRRVRGRGLVCVERTSGDRVRSAELKCWLREVEDEGRVRLRLAVGEGGSELIPMPEEVLAAEQVIRRIAEAQAQAEREARQAAEAQTRIDRAARESAEAEVARLRAEIERLRNGGGA